MRGLIAALALVALAGCASAPQAPGSAPAPTANVQQAIEVACFTLKSAHIGFHLFEAARPDVLSDEDVRVELLSYAGVEAFCQPPLDLKNYQDVVNKILFVAGAITQQLSMGNQVPP